MFDSLLSVGICTYNQKKLCTDLVKGLLQYGPADIKVFVWDNNPKPLVTEEFDDALRNDPRVTVIPDDKNSGYIIPNNRMAKMCNSEYHVVSNDDIIVQEGWWQPLIEAFKQDDRLAVVGGTPKFGYLDDEFHGQAVPPHGWMEYVEGWWMTFPRHVLDRYGLFDEVNLKVATCEDSDLCLRLQEYGWKIKAIPNLPIKHLEHQTKNVEKQYSWGFENHKYCKKRWRRYLRDRRFGEHVVKAKIGTSDEEIAELERRFPFSKINTSKGKIRINGITVKPQKAVRRR